MEIKLPCGLVALIDDQDFNLIKGKTWNSIKSRNVVYARFGRTYMHRLIMGAGKGQMIDHINGNGLDNRRENLRFAGHQLNRANSRVLNRKKTCKYVGVSDRGGKFCVQMKVDGKNKFYQGFKTAEDAALFYNARALEIHGPTAYQNKI